MGIEKFFNSLVKNEIIQTDNLLITKNNIVVDYIYIDFNSILYKIAMTIENTLNKLFYELLIGNVTQDSLKIASKWNYDTKLFNLNHFKNYFNEKYIDLVFIDFVKEDLEFITEKLIDGDKIKYIFISMDGVPNMAKIIEQKKRRYMGYILNESKKEIYINNTHKMDELRKIYEINKIKFSRGKILGFHEFMLKISSSLKSDNFVENLKKKHKQLKEYVFSGSNIPGEGEKKIMEDILSKNMKGNYAIYSPDADLIILSSIVLNKLNNNSYMHILRFDQQGFRYDIIDIITLNNNIYNYINDRITSELHNVVQKNNIINDIMFIFTMFGNDFIHKIESIDARKDFEILLNTYANYIIKKKSYIIENNKNDNSSWNINYENIKTYIQLLSEKEKDLLNDVYLLRQYKNYNHLKKQYYNIFWFDTLHKTLIHYTSMANIIFKIIKKWEIKFNNKKYNYLNSNKNSSFKKEINHDKLANYINKQNTYIKTKLTKYVNNIDDSIIRKNNDEKEENKYVHQFIKIFLIIELNVDLEKNGINDNNLYYNFIDILKKEIFKYNGKKIYAHLSPNLYLDEYKYTTKDKYHSKKIQETMISDKMKITDYDNEIYAFEFMLDKYKNKLNAVNDLIGTVHLKYVNNKYVYSYDNINKYHNNYYESYFGKKYNIDDISEKYFEGICWVFDFYFIKNDQKFNFDNVSSWFYEYRRSPMLTDISKYLNKKTKSDLTVIHANTINKNIKRNDFFNPLEHYLYVTPKNSINYKKDDSLNKIIENNQNVFPDLEKIVTMIMKIDKTTNGYNPNIPIDCRRASYFSKCTLQSIKDISYTEFVNTVKELRNDASSYEINENPYVKKWIDLQKGGNNIDEKLLNIMMECKIKYIESGLFEYYKIYNITKKMLHEINDF